ncbi:MAG: hypothetical protein GWP27_06740, partial [Bacteroidetes bacterium]|nr:hypothetical protein [Bacteroidota bacterium]
MKSLHLICSVALGILFFSLNLAAADRKSGFGKIPKPDELVSLDAVTLQTSTGKWFTVTVSFTPRKHPDPEKAFNEDFIDDVKLDLYICLRNDSREKKFKRERKREGTDYVVADLYDYYHAGVEIITLKVDNIRKELHFLISNELAERDGFNRTVKPVGHVVEMTLGGVPIAFKEGIVFEKYREESVLEKFKEFAQTKSKANEGLLLPAHMVNANYLSNAP